jgi:hypothetical protein
VTIFMAWTKEEKRERRQARHELQAVLKRLVLRHIGLFSTGPQIRQATKVLTDRYYAEQINPTAAKLRDSSSVAHPVVSIHHARRAAASFRPYIAHATLSRNLPT